jgi:xylan 1,4-beta-xylosidase
MLRRGVRGRPDVAALASRDANGLYVMVWHYHDDDVSGPDANVTLKLRGLPVSAKTAEMTHYRIDEEHSNAFALWKEMGAPQSPTDEQYAELELRGKLQTLSSPRGIAVDKGETTINFSLPRAGVSLLITSFSHH